MSKNLLLLHGAIGAQDQLQTLKSLLENKYNVYSMSFIGHGEREDTNEAFSMSLFANDVLQFMEKNNLEQTDVFGYSMGGYVALYLAKHYPKKIGKIVTLGTKFKWTPEIAVSEVKLLNADKIEQKVPKFASALEKRHFGSDWKTVLHKTASLLINLGENNTLQLEDYASITQPVKILLATHDDMVSEKESEAVVEQLPNGTFSYVKDSAHPIEKVDLSELIKHF